MSSLLRIQVVSRVEIGESLPGVTSLKSSRVLIFARGASVVSSQAWSKPSLLEEESNRSNTATQGMFFRKDKCAVPLYWAGNLFATRI